MSKLKPHEIDKLRQEIELRIFEYDKKYPMVLMIPDPITHERSVEILAELEKFAEEQKNRVTNIQEELLYTGAKK